MVIDKHDNSVLSTPIIVVMLSALAYFFGTGFNDVWLLAWFAPLPVMLFALFERKIKMIAIVAFASYFLGGLNILYYSKTILSIFYLLYGLFIDAIVFTLLILVFRFAVIKCRAWWVIFIFPCMWVLYEFMNAHLSSAGTFNSIAYSQLKFLPIVQIAAVTGIWGVSFLLCLVPSAIAVGWFLRANKLQTLSISVLTLILLLATLAFGFLHMAAQRPISFVKVGMLAVPETIEELHSNKFKDVQVVAERYLTNMSELMKQRAEITLLPEKIFTVEPDYQYAILGLFENLAINNQIKLIIGAKELKDNKKYNVAFIVWSANKMFHQYYKQHMLPRSEYDFVTGNQIVMLPLKNGFAGFAICKDMDFIKPALEYSQRGVGILFVPALDFVVDGWLHAKMAMMRGIEGGYTVVRAAQWGLLTVSDSAGRILAQAKTSNAQPVSLVATVPIYSGQTFYSRYGNWFIGLIGLIFILVLVGITLKKNNATP